MDRLDAVDLSLICTGSPTRYGEAAGFERVLAGSGMIFVKVWLHISAQEQLKRFRRRERDPLKRWKITEEDWRNHEKRPAYEAAVEEMLEHTDIPEAHWHVVSAESKRCARVAVMDTVIAEIERGCREQGFALPEVPA